MGQKSLVGSYNVGRTPGKAATPLQPAGIGRFAGVGRGLRAGALNVRRRWCSASASRIGGHYRSRAFRCDDAAGRAGCSDSSVVFNFCRCPLHMVRQRQRRYASFEAKELTRRRVLQATRLRRTASTPASTTASATLTAPSPAWDARAWLAPRS